MSMCRFLSMVFCLFVRPWIRSVCPTIYFSELCLTGRAVPHSVRHSNWHFEQHLGHSVRQAIREEGYHGTEHVLYPALTTIADEETWCVPYDPTFPVTDHLATDTPRQQIKLTQSLPSSTGTVAQRGSERKPDLSAAAIKCKPPSPSINISFRNSS
jgi:hypothetical protein